MDEDLIDEGFLSKNLSFTEKAKRSLKTSSRFDLFSGVFILLLCLGVLLLIGILVYEKFNSLSNVNSLEKVTYVLATIFFVFLLFFSFFKIKATLTIRSIMKNPSSNSLEKIFNEQSVSAIFLGLATVTMLLVIMVIFYAGFTNQF